MNEELEHLPEYWRVIVRKALIAEHRRGVAAGYSIGYSEGQTDARMGAERD